MDGAYCGSGIFARSLRPKYDGLEQADSFILDPHKWLLTPFDCCALLYRDPQLARATHTQDASYLDVIHTSEGEWNPSDYAYQLTRRARGLPLWFSLAVFGLEAYRQAIEVAASLPADRACRRCLVVLTTDDDGRGGSCVLQCLAGNGSSFAPSGFVKQTGS